MSSALLLSHSASAKARSCRPKRRCLQQQNRQRPNRTTTTPPTEAKMPTLAPVESPLNFWLTVSAGGCVSLSAIADLPLQIQRQCYGCNHRQFLRFLLCNLDALVAARLVAISVRACIFCTVINIDTSDRHDEGCFIIVDLSTSPLYRSF